MYLFDKERSGRLPFDIGEASFPKMLWEKKLPHFPVSAPESSAAIDLNGNIYFGCHNGCIYSIDTDGKTRWQFITRNKVYSSPLVFEDKVIFCCNGADVLCLSLNGEFLWAYEGFKELKKVGTLKKIFGYIYSYFVYDYHDKSINVNKITAWCSPNMLSNKTIIVNLYGVGVVAIDINSGKVIWKRSLGLPWFHLTGVAIVNDQTEEKIVTVSQSRFLFLISSKGEVVWKKKLKFLGNSWSNPSIDKEEKAIYCSTSFKNNCSYSYKYKLDGELVWSLKLPGGIRGSIAISYSDFVLIPCMNGVLYFVRKSDGSIIKEMKIASPNRGLWTSPTIDSKNNILVNVTENYQKGALIKIDSSSGKIIWKNEYGKALSVPVIDSEGNIYTGTWDSNYFKFSTK